MTARTTVLIPFLKGERTDWLDTAIRSFPPGTPYVIAENEGEMAAALNQALEGITTEFVLPFGADDAAAPGLIEFLEDTAWNADVVYPSMRLTNETMTVATGDMPAEMFCGNRLQDWNYVPGPSLTRTEKIKEVGGYRHLDSLEDWDLWVRLYRAGARFKPAPEAFLYYRRREGSRNSLGSRTREQWRQEIVGTAAGPDVKATFYYQATPATSYWRCVLPARHLPGVATSDLVGTQNELGHIEFQGHHGKAAVWQFAGSNDRAWSAINLQAQGVKILVEVDDNYLDEHDPVVRGRAGWGLKIGETHTSVQGHRWIVKEADGVICTTQKLAEIYADVNPNVYVCRNSLDLADWPEPPPPFPVGDRVVSVDDDVFRIGWFASFSHDRDEALVRRALSWASRQPGVEVVTMGYNPPWNFDRLHIPWSNDMGVYHRMMQLLHVGVCPVERTGWAVCRSDLKFLEYAMAGALPIVSRQPPYAEWLDTPYCLDASTAKDFEDRVRWCVRNQAEAREMAAKAKAKVTASRLMQHEIASWREAVSL